MNPTPRRDLAAGRAQQKPSLSEFAEQFASVVKEKQDLASRLSKALADVSAITQLHQRAHTEFDSERTRLNSEIDKLRAQLIGVVKRPENPTTDDARVQSLLAARERLIRDEFERKFQELTVAVRQERNKYSEEVQRLKAQLSNCICRA